MHNLRWTHFGSNNGDDLPPKKPGEKLLTMLIAIPDRYLLSEFFSRCTEHIVQRSSQYDAPELNLKRIADAWTNFLKREVTAYEVAVMMAMLKLCRLSQGYHQDTLEDAAAYIAIAELLKVTEEGESNES